VPACAELGPGEVPVPRAPTATVNDRERRHQATLANLR
jgi:hypothetical protein